MEPKVFRRKTEDQASQCGDAQSSEENSGSKEQEREIPNLPGELENTASPIEDIAPATEGAVAEPEEKTESRFKDYLPYIEKSDAGEYFEPDSNQVEAGVSFDY